MSDTTKETSEKLKPCPIPGCGGQPADGGITWAKCAKCGFQTHASDWQALPRASGELAEIVERMRKRAAQMRSPHVRGLASNGVADLLDQYAKRIATHAEKPGACSHWIGGEVRGRCGRDARAEKPGEDGPGKLGPFGGHGEPPKPPSKVAAVELLKNRIGRMSSDGYGAALNKQEMKDILAHMEQVTPPLLICDECGEPLDFDDDEEEVRVTICGGCASALIAEGVEEGLLQAANEPPSPIAAVVDLADRLDYVEVNLGHDTTKESREMLIAIAAQLRESAPEPVRGQEEAWVEFEDPDEIGVELLITDVHLTESDLHTERWVRVPVHGAPQTEQGDTQAETDCATCESTMDELRDKLAGAYDSLREHMDLVKDLGAELEAEKGARDFARRNHNRAIRDNMTAKQRIAELELALDNQPGDVISFCTRHCAASDRVDHARCRAERYDIGKECCNGLVAWASDSPAETDEGPCGGCQVGGAHQCQGQQGGICDDYDAYMASRTPCRVCGSPSWHNARGAYMCSDKKDCWGNKATLTAAGWLAENKQEQLPPHPKPNKA